MTPPRRRSSRLRGGSATPAKSISYASRLQSLTERDETPNSGVESSLAAILSSPIGPRTPATAGIKPSRAEMHPSQAHQSTTQQPDSGLRLGFTDMRTVGNDQPSGLTQKTPTKLGISSSFDFQFARPGPQLGVEAQRMMDDLREEALRIKARMAAEREEEERRNGDRVSGIEGRKIAQPKGKAGRFSDVHMAEFKKMDSIAGHPSAFRAQPGRFTPMKATLKRTQSKAQLDEREEIVSKPPPTLKRTQSRAQLDEREQIVNKHEQSEEKDIRSERLENTAPAKRARKHATDDTSSARPVSRHDNKPLQSASSIPRSQSSMIASLSTPTKASLARAATVHKPTTQIPTLARSPSKPNLLATPRGMTKSATMHEMGGLPKSESKATLHSPSRLDRMKSILRRPSSTIKKSMQLPSSIPTLNRSPSKPNFEKSLPSLPTTPGGVGDIKISKHVNFTPDTVNRNSATFQNSPSPVKSGIPRSKSRIQLGPKSPSVPSIVSSLESASVQYPSIAALTDPGKLTKDVEYPSLAGVRPLPQPPRQIAQTALPSVPGTFTFRTDHTISFGSSPKGFGSSPGQSSVRQVRQSIAPNMPGSFPSNNKENSELPTVPHGMSNKKRRRADSDDEADDENDRSPKKNKTVAEGSMLMAPDLQNKTPNSRPIAPVKKKGVLSLSRLNMLARPKVRK